MEPNLSVSRVCKQEAHESVGVFKLRKFGHPILFFQIWF